MNENTLNLVSAIINKDATDIESSFNAAMAEKIATRLDDMHNTIAQSMFAEEVELVELTQEEYDSLSEEEKQEFTLDEGLGKFVGKVVKGAANVVGNVIGGVAKTVGAVRQTPAAIGSAYNRGRAAAQKSIDK